MEKPYNANGKHLTFEVFSFGVKLDFFLVT